MRGIAAIILLIWMGVAPEHLGKSVRTVLTEAGIMGHFTPRETMEWMNRLGGSGSWRE